MLKIVIDENITNAKSAFNKFGEVFLLKSEEITNDFIKDADILIVRSTVNVNADLLRNSKIKFVGSATIGDDHIDKEYLKSKNIVFSNAEGCNAESVVEYIISALLEYANESEEPLSGKSIGIIGCGRIGSRVAQITEAFGMDVVKNDPPLKRLTGSAEYYELEKLFDCDFITIHAPLNKSGIDKSLHLLNEQNLNKINPNAVLINSARGAIIDNDILTWILSQKKLKAAILDVWENEPNISAELLKLTYIGTPHIAGYSHEGKLTGTKIIYDALCAFLKIEPEWSPIIESPQQPQIILKNNINEELIIYAAIKHCYNIKNDNDIFKKSIYSSTNIGVEFKNIRRNYPIRREFSAYYFAITQPISKKAENILKLLKFNFKL